MWDTFYWHSAYIQITFVTCQEGQTVSEHSFAGVQASLYNLTKIVPDPLNVAVRRLYSNMESCNLIGKQIPIKPEACPCPTKVVLMAQ